MAWDVRVSCVNDLMRLQARIVVKSCNDKKFKSLSHEDDESQTFIANYTNKVLLLRVSQHVLLQVLLLFESRFAALVIALERTILAVDILDVDLQFGSGGEGRRTLIAVIVLDLKVALQMLLDVLFLERAQAANVALKTLFFQVHSLIMATQVRCEEGFPTFGT